MIAKIVIGGMTAALLLSVPFCLFCPCGEMAPPKAEAAESDCCGHHEQDGGKQKESHETCACHHDATALKVTADVLPAPVDPGLAAPVQADPADFRPAPAAILSAHLDDRGPPRPTRLPLHLRLRRLLI